jgi:hypothetical protein
MRKFIFLIGSTDDFESLEALTNAYFELGDRIRNEGNASYYEFSLPENHDRGIALLVGRGIAFTNDWCMDGTFSTLLEA